MAFRFYLISRNACLANTSRLKLCFDTTIWNNYKYKLNSDATLHIMSKFTDLPGELVRNNQAPFARA